MQDLNQWVEGKHEVEIVDMILKLKQKLKICNDSTDCPSSAAALRSDTKEQLLKHLDAMKQKLPEDLKTILNNA